MKIYSGIDLVHIPRFKKIIDKNGPVTMENSFIKRVFNLEEVEHIIKRPNPYPGLAGRFAAKEAVIKAFNNIKKIAELKSIIVYGEAPMIKISDNINNEIKDFEISVSISHDGEYATALCHLLCL
jgi:holo-[acyl-carrier protein] synthase